MPEFINLLLASILADPWGAIVNVVAVASLICFGTPTPDPSSRFGRLYRVIEFLALNFGHAKDQGGPARANGQRRLGPLPAVLAAMLLSACAVTARPETNAQMVYAVEADYHLVQRAALAYVRRPDADPAIEARVKQMEAAAFDALVAARQAVAAGDHPAVPAALAAADHAVAALAGFLREKGILQ
ncbi:MAG: hypothetical protein HQL42_12995 [Alphaproteobacteria bacterium]|nr:hypothetical protein [Alphaproteobacteria bacterium]